MEDTILNLLGKNSGHNIARMVILLSVALVCCIPAKGDTFEDRIIRFSHRNYDSPIDLEIVMKPVESDFTLNWIDDNKRRMIEDLSHPANQVYTVLSPPTGKQNCGGFVIQQLFRTTTFKTVSVNAFYRSVVVPLGTIITDNLDLNKIIESNKIKAGDLIFFIKNNKALHVAIFKEPNIIWSKDNDQAVYEISLIRLRDTGLLDPYLNNPDYKKTIYRLDHNKISAYLVEKNNKTIPTTPDQLLRDCLRRCTSRRYPGGGTSPLCRMGCEREHAQRVCAPCDTCMKAINTGSGWKCYENDIVSGRWKFKKEVR